MIRLSATEALALVKAPDEDVRKALKAAAKIIKRAVVVDGRVPTHLDSPTLRDALDLEGLL